MPRILKLVILLTVLFSLTACYKVSDTPVPGYKTENVIVIVVDGARYSETWGDPNHDNIPRLANELVFEGVINTQFYNNGSTRTVPGHTSITTGFYEEIENTGKEIPIYPSFFQYYNSRHISRRNISWLITSKDKLEILNNCAEVRWNNKYQPASDCGKNGLGSGYRDDSLTFLTVMQALKADHPHLMLVNFKEPDYAAHKNDRAGYLNGIKAADEFVYQIIKFIERDSYYSGTTAVFVTNDHGRHLDDVANGFIGHGDSCEGCRHISFYASGPDFRKGVILDHERELPDITATIAELLHLQMPYCEGRVMYELFKTERYQ